MKKHGKKSQSKQRGKKTIPKLPTGKSKFTNKTKPSNSGGISTSKLVAKGKGKIQPVKTGKTKGRINKENEQVRAEHDRGSNAVNFSFPKIRAISKKVDSLKTSKVFDTAISKRLYSSKNYQGKGQGYKEPRGVVITLTDNKGRTYTRVSPPDFVVNKSNIKGYIEGVIEKMQADREELGDDIDENESGAPLVPANIKEISVRFIY